MRPRASVIVCVLDDFRVLRLLESLEAQRVERSLFEVVLVRAGREDYGSLLSRFDLSMKTVFSPTARLPVQRNLGVRAADGEFLLTTDADCVADAAWVGAMIRHLEDSPDDVAAVGGSIKKYATRTIVQRFGITIDDGQAGVNYLPALHLPYVTGANSAGGAGDRDRGSGCARGRRRRVDQTSSAVSLGHEAATADAPDRDRRTMLRR